MYKFLNLLLIFQIIGKYIRVIHSKCISDNFDSLYTQSYYSSQLELPNDLMILSNDFDNDNIFSNKLQNYINKNPPSFVNYEKVYETDLNYILI